MTVIVITMVVRMLTARTIETIIMIVMVASISLRKAFEKGLRAIHISYVCRQLEQSLP
jgi:hypothetical protein